MLPAWQVLQHPWIVGGGSDVKLDGAQARDTHARLTASDAVGFTPLCSRRAVVDAAVQREQEAQEGAKPIAFELDAAPCHPSLRSELASPASQAAQGIMAKNRMQKLMEGARAQRASQGEAADAAK